MTMFLAIGFTLVRHALNEMAANVNDAMRFLVPTLTTLHRKAYDLNL